MDFKVGEKAVYPGHGVGVIQAIEEFVLEGSTTQVYVLKILDNGMTIRIPIGSTASLGMRRLMNPDQVKRTYEVLKDRDVPMDKQTWNRRYREYVNKLHSGDPLEVAAVFRDLSLLKKEKSLSFGERKTYDQAMSLLVQELAAAKDVDEDKIRKELDKIFKA